jgi:sigma-B regulation protein RsbU (phosphoserine phosphatase)
LIRAIDEVAFNFIQKPFDRRVLQALVARCLELRGLRIEHQRQLRRLQQELTEARQFQHSFLPPPSAQAAGLRIATRHLSCQEVAGDFFDYVDDGGKFAFLVADVVGHGASAAMMTAVVKTAFRASHTDGYHPASVVAALQRSLSVFDDSRFVTAFCARLDVAAGELEFINAGHPPSIVRDRQGRVTLLEPTGPLICPALVDIPCETGTHRLAAGDCLLAYTDGLADTMGDGDMFGHNQIRTIIAHSRQQGDSLLAELMDQWDRFRAGRPHDDDVTVLLVAVDG